MIVINEREYLDIESIMKVYNMKYDNVYQHLSRIEPLKLGNVNLYKKEDIEELMNRIDICRMNGTYYTKIKRNINE
jgi:hypothetical protein